jgi:hypothetical protein
MLNSRSTDDRIDIEQDHSKGIGSAGRASRPCSGEELTSAENAAAPNVSEAAACEAAAEFERERGDAKRRTEEAVRVKERAKHQKLVVKVCFGME